MAFETDITKLGWFDKTLDNCEVVTIPAGSLPKFVKVKLPSPEEPVIDAYWSGIPDIEVGSLVSVRRSPGNMAQYSVAGGGLGTAPPTEGSVGGAWPAAGEVKIGETVYADLADAQVAAVAGDVVKLGEGTFPCNDLAFADGVSMASAGNAIISQTNDANCLTLNNATITNIRFSVSINSANDRDALTLVNTCYPQNVRIAGSNAGAGVVNGFVYADTDEVYLPDCESIVDGNAVLVDNVNAIVTVANGTYSGGAGGIEVTAGFVNLLFPNVVSDNVTPFPATRGIWFDSDAQARLEMDAKATPVDADKTLLGDSTASFGLKWLTWANLKATLKTYFDTLYPPVTLAADADTILGLSTQQLTLDTQTANTVFAGPTSGGAADPTFRALVDADIPAAIARDSEVTFAVFIHEEAADPHPDYMLASTYDTNVDGILNTGALPAATESAQGAAELATQTETNTGTDDAQIVTPAKLNNATTVVHPARSISTTAPLSGGGDLSADRTISITAYGARVYNNANISCSNGGWTAMTFNSEEYDNGSIHSTSSNTGRLTAPVAGIYVITGHGSFDVHATGSRGARIFLNGTTQLAVQFQPSVGVSLYTEMTITTIMKLAANDYVTLEFFQNSGGSLNILTIEHYSPCFEMQLVGPPS